jgi:hypothetical protein
MLMKMLIIMSNISVMTSERIMTSDYCSQDRSGAQPELYVCVTNIWRYTHSRSFDISLMFCYFLIETTDLSVSVFSKQLVCGKTA